MEFEITYTNKEVTPWGGMVFLKQMLQKIGFRDLIDQNPDLPQPGSNRLDYLEEKTMDYVVAVRFTHPI